MALSNQQVFDYYVNNPGMTDADALEFMRRNAVSPYQVASTFGLPIGEVIARLSPFLPQNQAVLLGDTWIQGNYQTIGSGEDQQTGPLESINVYKTTGGINDKVTEGTDIQNYSPTGEFIQTTKMGKDLSFFGGIKQALKDPYVLGALALATAGATGLLSGGTALTATELAQLDLATGGIGGSGIVILRIPTVYYTGAVTGSVGVTTDGNFTVITFTGNGTYTA